MKRLLFSLLMASGLLLGAINPAVYAQDTAAEEIRQMLEQRDREIKQTLDSDQELTSEERNRLQKVINENIDFRAMGRGALGPFWEKISQEQRGEFLDTFTQIVREQSLSNIKIYRAQVTYEDITVEGDSAHVQTITTHDRVQTPVAYDLYREDDSWKVVDIVIDGVSTVDSYARSFQTVIRKRGFDALMSSLEKKLAKMQAGA